MHSSVININHTSRLSYLVGKLHAMNLLPYSVDVSQSFLHTVRPAYTGIIHVIAAGAHSILTQQRFKHRLTLLLFTLA